MSKTLAKRVAPTKPAAKMPDTEGRATPAKKSAAVKKAAPAKTKDLASPVVPEASVAESRAAAPASPERLASNGSQTVAKSVATRPLSADMAAPTDEKPDLTTMSTRKPEARKPESPDSGAGVAKRPGTPALAAVTPAAPPRSHLSTMSARPAPPAPFEPQRPSVKIDPRLANVWKSKPGRELSDDELMAMPDSEYMNEKQLEFFRSRLEGQRESLLSNAGETTEHLREDTSIVPDPADRATIEEEHALELRTRDRERKLLKKISQALARIDAGDYGFCDETGEPIGLPRLIARPTATLSLEAQQRRELKQRLFGD